MGEDPGESAKRERDAEPAAPKETLPTNKSNDGGTQPGAPPPPTKRLKTSHDGIRGTDVSSSKEQVQQALAHARSKVSLLVKSNQLSNPVLKYVRHVRKEEHEGLSADYVCGPTTCVLYLSLQYHKLHPTYIYQRVKTLGQHFRLRVLLVQADVADHSSSMHELSRLALLHNLTLVCAGSHWEAARYLETLRCYDTKGAEGIQERVGNDYASRLNAALSSIRGVNRTDVSTLAFTFGSVGQIALAGVEDLRKCPGLGERKVTRLYTALHQPFLADAPWTGMVDDNDDDAVMDEDNNVA